MLIHTYSAKNNFIYYLLRRKNFDSDFGHFFAEHVLEIGLPWQQLRSLVTKKYTN